MLTVTQLVLVVHDFASVLDGIGQTDVLFLLLLLSASEKVPHAKLLCEL